MHLPVIGGMPRTTRFCAWLCGGSAHLAEHLTAVGYDAIVVDCQHGFFSFDALVATLTALGAGKAHPIVRVSELNPAGGEIGRALDAGAKELICPMVTSAAECRSFVKLAKYPPVGRRSFGPFRAAIGDGRPAHGFTAAANQEIKLHAMIETVEAMDALDDILAVDGIDGIFIGPNDLALALGHAPSSAPMGRVMEVVEDVLARTHLSGKTAGIFANDPATAHRMATLGFDLVNVGLDTSWLVDAATTSLRAAKAPPTDTEAPSLSPAAAAAGAAAAGSSSS